MVSVRMRSHLPRAEGNNSRRTPGPPEGQRRICRETTRLEVGHHGHHLTFPWHYIWVVLGTSARYRQDWHSPNWATTPIIGF